MKMRSSIDRRSTTRSDCTELARMLSGWAPALRRNGAEFILITRVINEERACHLPNLRGHVRAACYNLATLNQAGIYIHIPFCRSRCSYCDFATGMYTADMAERYVR